MPEPINLQQKLNLISEQWSPRVVAEMNEIQFKLAKVQGEFVWHSHAETDEAFYIVKGKLTILLREGEVNLSEGELYVVQKGVEHNVLAEEECHMMLIEPRGVVNTGEAGGDKTAELDVWI